MQPWFTWKNKNSYNDFGLWINKLPPIVRSNERHEEITVPGREGTLLMTEGEDVYDSYLKECVVIVPNTRNIQPILAWLRGNGDVTFCNEVDFAYEARIIGEVSFERINNSLSQATIPFFVKPYKKRVHGEPDMTITASGTIVNPGDVASKPMVRVQKTGAAKIVIGDTSMEFTHLPGDVMIDCDAGLITTKAGTYSASAYYYVGDYANYSGDSTYSAGLYRFTSEGLGENTTWERVGNQVQNYEYVWQGSWTGKFLRIPAGRSAITLTGSPTLTVQPKWRWV